MVHTPYVTSGSTSNNNYTTSRPTQSGYSSNNGYAPAPASSSSGYAPASSSSYGASYGAPISGMTSSTYTSGSGGYSSSQPSYNSGSSYAPSSSYNSSSNNATPDFSQALDLPPPNASAPSTNYGSSSTGGTTDYGSSSTGATSRGPFKPSSLFGGGSSGGNSGSSNSPAKLMSSFLGGGGSGNNGNSGNTYSPSAPVATGGYHGGPDKPTATVYATHVGPAGGALSSTNYGTGPTGGLVSEGNPTNSHKIDYEIKGHEMQLVEIELDPQETVIAEAGALMYLEEGIDFKTKFGDGSTPKEGFFKKLMAAGGRLLAGESLFITHFTNIGHTKARAAFAAPYPGNIMPMNLQQLGGSLICQKDGFLCAAKGTKLSVHFNRKIGSGLFGGEGFILQKLSGDGLAFIHAGGTVIRRELRGEKLRIDTGCVVAFTEGINFDIQLVPGLKSMIFGGEGLCFAILQGTGTVWMQSLPFSRMCDRIVQHAPSIGGRRQDEGSALTGRFGDIANGDGFGFKF